MLQISAQMHRRQETPTAVPTTTLMKEEKELHLFLVLLYMKLLKLPVSRQEDLREDFLKMALDVVPQCEIMIFAGQIFPPATVTFPQTFTRPASQPVVTDSQ